VKTSVLRCGVVALAIGTPLCAAAQPLRAEETAPGYRPDLPAVNLARPAQAAGAAQGQTAEAFRRWYAQAKRPSMVVFWNREQTDQTTSQVSIISTTREEASASWSRRSAQASASSTTEVGLRAAGSGTYAAMDPLESAQLEGAFQGAWLQNGARLIDRTAIIRKKSVGASREDRSDVQFLEAAALEQGVHYLVEVLPVPRSSSPTGHMFMVKVKHLPSATVVAQFTTAAKPPAGPTRLVAAPGGFERRRDQTVTPETIGAELAYQTMSRLR
jgi:hypothetical protein